jgi:hypothetical protein
MKYFHVEPNLNENISIDNHKKIPILEGKYQQGKRE